jgi:hypothetical protein
MILWLTGFAFLGIIALGLVLDEITYRNNKGL